jgi:hypothetical protein
MSDADFEKRMEFILEQQAQVTVSVQQLGKAQVEAEKRISRMEGAFVGLVNLIGDSNNKLEAKISELAEQQKRTDLVLAETGERLNALIDVVERSISEGRNGNG